MQSILIQGWQKTTSQTYHFTDQGRRKQYSQYGHGRTKFWQKIVELWNMNLSNGNAQKKSKLSI